VRFALVDSILELKRGERIVAVKAVSLAEEYLADHFPTFPVLPGVFILQGLVEAATWLAYDALDFAPVVILLKEAKNVTYKSFVKPGNLLRLEVTCRRVAPDGSEFEGTGLCGQTEMVRARFSLAHHGEDYHRRIAAAVSPTRMVERKARFELLRQTQRKTV
jgi:3-hydroxyacyl-[acyl-carrier-protein] dehydratase